MVALAKIDSKKAVSLWENYSEAFDAMYIDADEFGTFALVHGHRVSILEIGKQVPRAVSCDCEGHQYGHVCWHMHTVSVWYQEIHQSMHPSVVVQEKAPAIIADMADAQVDEMSIAHDVEASHQESEVIMPQVAKKASPWVRSDDRLYCVWVKGNVIYCYWSEMTHAQKATQLAFERDETALRAQYMEHIKIFSYCDEDNFEQYVNAWMEEHPCIKIIYRAFSTTAISGGDHFDERIALHSYCIVYQEGE